MSTNREIIGKIKKRHAELFVEMARRAFYGDLSSMNAWKDEQEGSQTDMQLFVLEMDSVMIAKEEHVRPPDTTQSIDYGLKELRKILKDYDTKKGWLNYLKIK